MTQLDPAAPFTARLGQTDRRAAEPLDHKTHAAGLLPDPRNPNGPTYYRPAPPRTLVDRLTDWTSNQAAAMRINTYGHAAVPDEPERYETPRGWARPYVFAGAVVMAGAALLIAALALLPW